LPSGVRSQVCLDRLKCRRTVRDWVCSAAHTRMDQGTRRSAVEPKRCSKNCQNVPNFHSLCCSNGLGLHHLLHSAPEFKKKFSASVLLVRRPIWSNMFTEPVRPPPPKKVVVFDRDHYQLTSNISSALYDSSID